MLRSRGSKSDGQENRTIDCRGDYSANAEFSNALPVRRSRRPQKGPPFPPATLPQMATTPPADPTPVAPAEEACEDCEELRETRYVYKNNVWNKGAITGYEQRVMRRVVETEDRCGWRWMAVPRPRRRRVIARRQRPRVRPRVRAYPEIVRAKGLWDTLSARANLQDYR